MKQILRKLSIAALAFVGVMTVSCSNLEITPIQPHSGLDTESSGTVTLTTTVGIETSPATKALDADGKKTFAAGEKVALIYTKSDGSTKAVSEYAIQSEDIHDSGKKATLSFTLTDPKEGAVTLVYPAALASTTADDGIDQARLQNAQNGTLATLSANFDAATASDNMTVSGTSAVLSGSINLTNPLCIGEFTIKEGDDDITNKLLRLTVSDGTNQYVINRLATDGPVYVAMKPISSDKTVTVSATDGLDYYSKTVTSSAHATLAANNMYPINVTVTKTDDRATPLTFEAKAAGAKVSFKLPSTASTGDVQYKVDGGGWANYVSNTAILLENAGSKVQFRGKINTYFNTALDFGNFSITEQACYVYGNVMSLVTDWTPVENAFATNITLAGENAFFRLFKNTTNLTCHDSKSLVFPATTLTTGCYQEMFDGCAWLTSAPTLPSTTLAELCYDDMFCGCTGLTTAPALPAMTLASTCYQYMFRGCSGLKNAPALPATTLDYDCYMGMFSSCTSLTVAPDLPATTLASSCYQAMFYGCSGLITAPDLPATSLKSWCYMEMFERCTGLTTAPALPATTLANSCYMQMFSGCTGLTTAPVLAAPTLVSDCYDYMFDGCSNLNRVTCLAKDGIKSDCCDYWLRDVADSGTFIRAAGNSWLFGASGIPFSWVEEEDISTCTGNFTVYNEGTLTGTLANSVQISIDDGATVTLDNLSINADGVWTTGNRAGITCAGNATITLVGTNTVKGFNADYPGILVPNGNTLTINGTGSLTASSQGGGSGIGGKVDGTCGNISITGGTVNASSNEGTGIGSGYCYTGDASCGNISISGGTVVATGGGNSAGIGTGSAPDHSNSCGTITISGTAHVTATGGASGAGIGTGNASVGSSGGSNHCGAIRIEGGTVIATGGEGAAAIGTGAISASGGSGGLNDCVSIEITTGITSVTATKGSGAPNVLGAGKEYSGGNTQCNTVTITGLTKAESGDTWTLTPKTP